MVVYEPVVAMHLTPVNILLAVSMLVGVVVWAKADSVFSVHFVQSAFLLCVNVRRFCSSL